MSRKKVADLYFSEKRYFEIFEGVNLIGSNKNCVTVYIEKPVISEVQAAIIVNGSEHYFSNLNPLVISKLNHKSVNPFICNILKPETFVSIGELNFTYSITNDKKDLEDGKNSNTNLTNEFLNVSNSKFNKTDIFTDDDDDFIPSTQFIIEENGDKNVANTAIDETWIDEMDVSDLELANINVNLEKKSNQLNELENFTIQNDQKSKQASQEKENNSKNILSNIVEDIKLVFDQETEWIDDSEKLNKPMELNCFNNNPITNKISTESTESIEDLKTQLILNFEFNNENLKNIKVKKSHDNINSSSKIGINSETQFDLNCNHSRSYSGANVEIIGKNTGDVNKKSEKNILNDETQFDFEVPENNTTNISKIDDHEGSLYEKIYRQSAIEYSQEIGVRKSVIGKRCPVIEDSDSDDSIVMTQIISNFKINSNNYNKGSIQINESSDDDIFEDEIKAGNNFQINTLDLLEAGTSGIKNQNERNSSPQTNDSSIQIFDFSTQIIDVDSIESPKNIENISNSKNIPQIKSIFDTPVKINKRNDLSSSINNFQKQCPSAKPVNGNSIFDIATQVIDSDILIKKNINSNETNENINLLKSKNSFPLKSIFDTPKIKNDLNQSFDIFNASTQLPDDLVSDVVLCPKEEKTEIQFTNFQEETPRFDLPADISILEPNKTMNQEEVKTFITDAPTQIIDKKDETKEVLTKPKLPPQFKPKLLLTDDNISNDESNFQRPKPKSLNNSVRKTVKKSNSNDVTNKINNFDIHENLTQLIDDEKIHEDIRCKTILEKMFKEKDKLQQNWSDPDEILTQLVENKNPLEHENEDIENILTQIIENDVPNNRPDKNLPQTSGITSNIKRKNIDFGTSFIQIIENNKSRICDNLDEDLTQLIDKKDVIRENVSSKCIPEENLTQILAEDEIVDNNAMEVLTQVIENINNDDLTQLIDEKNTTRPKTEDLTQNINNINGNIPDNDITVFVDEKNLVKQNSNQKLENANNDVIAEDLKQLRNDKNADRQNLIDDVLEDATQIIEANGNLENAPTQLINENDLNTNDVNPAAPITNKTRKNETTQKNLNSIENFPIEAVNNSRTRKNNNKRTSNFEVSVVTPKKGKRNSSKKLHNENEHKCQYNTRSRSKK